MLDRIYVYIFGHFYFYDSIFLVNYTDCITICNDKGMKLPNADDNDFILRQLESQFGKENFITSNEISNRTPNKNFLAYFIGSFKHQITISKPRSNFKTQSMIFKKINGYQLETK